MWHPAVRYYEIFAEDGTHVGSFYTDWFPRKEKRQGAWMNDFITGGPRAGRLRAPPGSDLRQLHAARRRRAGAADAPGGARPPSTSSGTCSTTARPGWPFPAAAGINVAWDWVELPSQFMENWCWEREALDLFARHHETGEPFPEELFQRMVAARRYMGGWAQMRQLSFGTVDLDLHDELAPALRVRPAASPVTTPDLDEEQGEQVMAFTRRRFRDFAPTDRFADLHSLTSFTHLFSGGYAAGYYSYLWSEVLDADVFTRFRTEGIFNRETGRALRGGHSVAGRLRRPRPLFREFMGRDPDPTALLERNLGPLE